MFQETHYAVVIESMRLLILYLVYVSGKGIMFCNLQVASLRSSAPGVVLSVTMLVSLLKIRSNLFRSSSPTVYLERINRKRALSVTDYP